MKTITAWQYVGLKFEKHCVSERVGPMGQMGWLERDPEVGEWIEAVEPMNRVHGA